MSPDGKRYLRVGGIILSGALALYAYSEVYTFEGWTREGVRALAFVAFLIFGFLLREDGREQGRK